tara:strand:- start:223 stop:897 length:675 start_codon:yes stop_codon:yes gene_type:complete
MEIFKYSLSYNFLKHLYLSFKKNHSPIRLIHNYFLMEKKIQGTTIDLGAGEGSNTSYYEFLDCKDAKIERSDFFKSSDVKIDLENKLDLEDQCCDNVILFNTLEHIENYKNLLSEIKRILRTNGRLEIFVPFLVAYHPDPKDFFRPTHFYLEKLLTAENFAIETNLIGVGAFITAYQNIYRYLKLPILKTFFFIFFDIFNKILQHLSKDHWKYYCGVHITCVKK